MEKQVNKYTVEQLKGMADVVMMADDFGDPRALQLYITLSAITGIEPLDVRDRVRRLADGN